ncbi:MAG: hypothetical protein NVS9B15_09490 [Acidobacteriaceae bacterium]
MTTKPSFGFLLKRFRRRAHLTQQELAERAGYSVHYVSMLERGTRIPQPLTIDVLADALPLNDAERVSLHATCNLSASLPTRDIPVARTPLLGREVEVEWITAMLRRPGTRLITVTGPGGVGKTCLAQHVSAGLASSFAGGTAFVDLAGVEGPVEALSAIAASLLPLEHGDQPPVDRLVAFFQKRAILLLLDSFERVLSAATEIHACLMRCPQLKILITSRVALTISSEQEYPLQPLAVPDAHAPMTNALSRNAAISLFVHRARLIRPDFDVDERELAVVAEICRRVDGLPLAIELAAAQVAYLPLTVLRDRLDRRLEILTGGSGDLPVRQQRMRDTISWSYDLLAPNARLLFRSLAVFGGRWSLEAAESVCAATSSDDTVLDGLRTLVRASLVLPVDIHDNEPRYRMLDTIQEYATELLAVDHQAETIRRHHAQYYLCLAEMAEPALQGGLQGDWYARLVREHDNIRTALRWLFEADDVEDALRLAGAIWRFWQRHGDFAEGRRWLERGLTQRDGIAPWVRAKALWGASWLAYHQGDFARARVLSSVHLEVARESNDPVDVRNALTGLGIVSMAEGRYADAVRPLTEALEICEPLGSSWHLATSYLNLGTAAMHVRDLPRARTLCERALALYRQLGDDLFTAVSIEHLGYVALLLGDDARASEHFRDSLKSCSALRDTMRVAEVLEGIAAVRAKEGRPAKAARLLGAATALRESIGGAPPAFLRPLWQSVVEQASRNMHQSDWDAALHQGHEMSMDEAVSFALKDTP